MLSRGFLRSTDDVLRGREAGPLLLALQAFVWAAVYGAAMGTFGGFEGGRALQVVFSAIKVPLLFLTTFGLCLPTFFVVNTLFGLRSDFPRAVRALLGAQAAMAIVLCSCAPFTLLVYGSTRNYSWVLLWNGALFAAASLAGQVVVRAAYRPLVRQDPRHGAMLRVWLGLYVAVAIQLAWVLRPFVGSPTSPIEFFRAESWGNAYVVVLRLIARAIGAG
jgi:hypothetical protein